MLILNNADGPEFGLLTGSAFIHLQDMDTVTSLQAVLPTRPATGRDFSAIATALNPARFATAGTVYVRVDGQAIYMLATGFAHVPPPLWDALDAQGATYADLTTEQATPLADALGGHL